MSKRKLSIRIRQLPISKTMTAAAAIGALRLVALVPYERRVPLGGWAMRRVISPLLGYPDRIRNNLSMVYPQMSASDQSLMVQRVTDHIGRTVTEIFSPDDLLATAKNTPVSGAGATAVIEAQAVGQPVIFVSGHLGNYDVWRAALTQRGMALGALYRKMNNTRFNNYYVSKIESVSQPMFPRGRQGLAEMIKFLRQGNAVALLIDQHVKEGAPLEFFGETAHTAVSAAEMALKYKALLVPIYAIRQPDGLNFEIIIEDPVPHGDPLEMTQKLNDSLEAQVRVHTSQWFWVHRRWKKVAA